MLLFTWNSCITFELYLIPCNVFNYNSIPGRPYVMVTLKRARIWALLPSAYCSLTITPSSIGRLLHHMGHIPKTQTELLSRRRRRNSLLLCNVRLPWGKRRPRDRGPRGRSFLLGNRIFPRFEAAKRPPRLLQPQNPRSGRRKSFTPPAQKLYGARPRD